MIENIWRDRYCKNGESYDDELRRVAKACATTPSEEEEFYNVMSRGLFFPAGRTMSNAGLGKDLTLNNCFVAPAIKDDFDDIFPKVYLGAKTHQRGGGIGYAFSYLRPRGTPTSNDAIASGPVSFMDVFNAQTATVNQGSRRGANMGVLSVYHPDIWEFIEAKSKDPNRLQFFNLSVMVDDAFMHAVENDEDIYLHWPVYDERGYHITDPEQWVISRKESARKLWDAIMRQAYDTGEPGVFFYDNLNGDNDIWYKENIVCGNPCFTGDMELLTVDGYKTFSELDGRDDVCVISHDGSVSTGNRVWCSGEKDTVKIHFSGGKYITCTPNHVFMLNDGSECEAKDLRGKRVLPYISLRDDFDDTYVKLGFIQGDGEFGRLKSKYHNGLVVHIGENDQDIAALFSGDKIFSNNYVSGYNQIMRSLGFSGESLPHREMPSTYFAWEDVQKRSFLRGMFSANGCVAAHHRIQYKTTCRELANEISKALSEFGIHTNITTNKPKEVEFPNGVYTCKESFDVCINRYASMLKFAELIGFVHQYKRDALIDLLRQRAPYVTGVTEHIRTKVYDFTENNNHWGVVNGVVAHNCAEYLAGTVYGNDPRTGEPLDPGEYGGACNLGSLFLHRFVISPFTPNARFDCNALDDTISVAVRMLDNIIDINKFPSPIYENYQKAFRTIGLGVTGLADALAMLGMRYNSREAMQWTNRIMSHISARAFLASSNLAAEKGSFPFYNADKYLRGGFLERHKALNDIYWNDAIEAITKNGIRNAKIMSIAPTGTLSLAFGNNCSSGIEPIFCLDYERKVKIGGQEEENARIVHMEDYAYHIWKELGSPKQYADVFVTALEMSVDDHIDMLSHITRHVDMSVSKTINVPTDYSFEDTKNIYMKAWKLGIKGCTIFRPNEIRKGILITDNNGEDACTETCTSCDLPRGVIIGVNDDLLSAKRTVVNGCGKFYIHIDFDESTGEFLETYIDLGSGGGCERNLQFISRLMSLALRSGVPLEAIIDQASSIRPCKAYTDRTRSKGDTSPGTSCPSAIGRALLDLQAKINSFFGEDDEDAIGDDKPDQKKITDGGTTTENNNIVVAQNTGAVCPECGGNLRFEGGCNVCPNCGWSKCG